MQYRSFLPPSRRLVLRALLGAGACAPIAALAGFNFFTSEYTASREELQAQIAKRFPVQQRYAEIFTVALRAPRRRRPERASRRPGPAGKPGRRRPVLKRKKDEGRIKKSSFRPCLIIHHSSFLILTFNYHG